MRTDWVFEGVKIVIFVILFTILLLPFVYIAFPNIINLLPQPSSAFWDNSIGNLLATVLALIGGIPVALWIDRLIKKHESLNKLRSDRLEEKKVLDLIKEELIFNLNSLFLKGKKGNTKTMVVQPLKSDLWNALIASGETKYIENFALLNRITSAYYVLKIVKDIEKQAYVALRTSAIVFTDTQGVKANAAQLLLQDARTFDILFENNLKEALKAIDKRLKGLKKKNKWSVKKLGESND